MTRATIAALALGLAAGLSTPATRAEDEAESRPIYELRTYTTAPGKLGVLLDRFGEHNLPLFREHGITLVGAWTPLEPDEQGDRLVYLVSFPDREAAKRAWDGFSNDPDWKAVFGKEKQEHGDVVTKVENVFVVPTDYSPVPETGGDEHHVYEMRRYIASPGKIQPLHERFRDHTIDIFRNHGMTSVLYTVPMDQDKGAEDTLIYFLSFPDREAARASWKAFSDDPAWQKVYRESQPDGVKLAGDVKSVFLKPTDFSPLK